MLIGTPPALDSYWALIAVLLSLPLLGLRIADEERMLVQDLDGYREYMIRVPYRLVPHVW